jgi:hypothetical protein
LARAGFVRLLTFMGKLIAELARLRPLTNDAPSEVSPGPVPGDVAHAGRLLG